MRTRPTEAIPVEFTTLEAVLVGPKLVMPAQTKLFGRIVDVAPHQGDKPSWILLLVETAAWKQHRVPLHAFISGQITLAPAANQNSSSADATPAIGGPRRSPYGRTGARTGSVTSADKFPQGETVGSPDEIVENLGTLKDIRIVRGKDGTSYLVSAKTNVKLPGGAFFMLQNHPLPAADQSTTSRPH